MVLFYSIVSPSLNRGIRTHTDHRVWTQNMKSKLFCSFLFRVVDNYSSTKQLEDIYCAISSDVQQHPLVLWQNQAEFNFIQMSSDALWERLLATDSTETCDLQQFLHRRCDCGFTVSTIDSSVPFIFIPKNFSRNIWDIVFQWTCLFAHKM